MKHLLPILMILTVVGCGIVPSQAEYTRVGEGRSLELPPGLDQPAQRGVVIPETTGDNEPVDEQPLPLEEASVESTQQKQTDDSGR